MTRNFCTSTKPTVLVTHFALFLGGHNLSICAICKTHCAIWLGLAYVVAARGCLPPGANVCDCVAASANQIWAALEIRDRSPKSRPVASQPITDGADATGRDRSWITTRPCSAIRVFFKISDMAVSSCQRTLGGSLLFPPVLFPPSPPLTLPFPFLFPLLEVGPLNPARRSGERCKLLSRVWGRTPDEIELGAF